MHKKTPIYFVIVSLLFVFSGCTSQNKSNFSQWRGPERNGIYPEEGLLTEWSEGGPKLLWSYDKLGYGFTSATVTSDRVFTTGILDTIGVIFAFNQKGDLLWKKKYGPEWVKSFPGTRTTPVVVDDKAYWMSGLGVVYCIDTKEGDFVWQKNVLTEFNGVNAEQGMTENLLIDGEKIYCTPGGPENNVLALNRINGELIWKSKGNGEISAYCSPLLIELGGRKYIITITAKSVISIDAGTGEMMWRWGDLKYKYPNHPSTPIFSDGCLYVNDGGAGGSSKLRIAADGRSVETVWTNNSLDDVLGGAILMNDRIFTASSSKKGWICADWNTGNELYMTDTIPGGSLIAAEGLLYCYSVSGEFGLFQPGDTGFNLKGLFKVEGTKRDHWALPVIKDGRLYVRYNTSLWVYDIKK